MQYTIFIHMNATRAWLTLSLEARQQFIAEELGPIIGRYPNVDTAFYDAEAFNSYASDVAVMKTDSLKDYAALIDDLRSSRLLTVPYFEFVQIIPAIEADYLAD